MRQIIAIACLILLAACSGIDSQKARSGLQKAIAGAETTYAVAQVGIAAYHALTPCGEPGAAKVCYDANSGAVADRALAALRLALDTAKAAEGSDKPVDAIGIAAAVTTAALNIIPVLHQLGVL